MALNIPEVTHFISDHAFVQCQLAIPKPPVERKLINYRQLKAIDLDLFKRDILLSSLGTIPLGETITETPLELDRLVALYDTTFQTLLDKHAPIRSKIITVRPTVPWMNDVIKQSKRLRRKAERQWRNCSDDPLMKLFYRREFQLRRNELKIKLIKSKTEYYSGKVLECSNDQYKLFNLMNSLLKRKQGVQYPESASVSDLPNEFGEFFVSKIDKIRHELDDLNLPSIDHHSSFIAEVQCFRSFSKLSEDDVAKRFCQSPTKHCISDPIPTWLLKQCMDAILPFLTLLVNMSLGLGYFPRQWKKAIVTPILKKVGADTIVSNYRPVSNLSFLSKLVERVVVSQLSDHMTSNNILPSNQSAYRQFHSTETSLLKVQSDILMNFDNQKVTLLVLLDLSAAFDTIDHTILLRTIESQAGVSSIALRWFSSYLEGRTQCVRIFNEMSKGFNLRFGVPQGSCLGPVLFTIYAAPLLKIIEHHLPQAQGYADDHQLYIAFNPNSQASQENALIALQACISEIRQWMLVNKLKINDNKTEFLIMGSMTTTTKS